MTNPNPHTQYNLTTLESGVRDPVRSASERSPKEERRSRLLALARGQHGVVSRAQCAAIDMTPAEVKALVRGGQWHPAGPRLLQASGAPESDLQRAMIAVLDAGPGAQLSHDSAAAIWGVPGYDLTRLQVCTTRRGSPFPSQFATVHRHRALASIASTEVERVPVVRPEVMVIQLCATASAERAGSILDRAWRERLLSGPVLARVLASVPTQGLAGVGVVRQVLAERGPGYVPPASTLEGRATTILRENGIHGLVPQVDLGDVEHWCGRVDLFDRRYGIVLEVDSEKFHTALVDVAHDARRQKRLEAAGFDVVRVTDFQVWHRPREVIQVMAAARRRAYDRRAA
jgi:hypothetical protein